MDITFVSFFSTSFMGGILTVRGWRRFEDPGSRLAANGGSASRQPVEVPEESERSVGDNATIIVGDLRIAKTIQR